MREQLREQPVRIGPLPESLELFPGYAGSEEMPGSAPLVDGGDAPLGGACQCPGAVGNLLEYGVEVEARTDPQDGVAQAGDALLQRLDALEERGGVIGHGWPFPGVGDLWVRRPMEYRRNLIAIPPLIAHGSLFGFPIVYSVVGPATRFPRPTVGYWSTGRA